MFSSGDNITLTSLCLIIGINVYCFVIILIDEVVCCINNITYITKIITVHIIVDE